MALNLDYANPKTRDPKVALTLRQKGAIAICLALGIVALVVFPLPDNLPSDREDEIVVLRPWFVGHQIWFLAGAFLLPLIGAALLMIRRRVLKGILVIVGAFLACAGALIVVTMSAFSIPDFAPWVVFDSARGSDGRTYCFVDSSILQAQTLAIARVKSKGVFYERLELLGSTNGDSPRSYLLVVRPVPCNPASYGAIYATAEGQIVSLRHDSHCYMVYDIASGHFYGHEEVEALSPYLLHTNTSALNSDDEREILSAMAGNREMGVPIRAVLTEALQHPNPAVRLSADRMLKALKP